VASKTTYQEKAPAKINLYLEVLDRKFHPREDGYHNVKTLYQTIDLFDSLIVEIETETSKTASDFLCDIIIKSNVPEIEKLGDRNLIHKAISLYLKTVPDSVKEPIAKLKFVINLEKRIPVSAGLGGGSADAAAMLRVINEFFFDSFRFHFSPSSLTDIAVKLGADIPFCLNSLTHPRAYAEGVGEIFTERRNNLNFNEICSLVLVKPDFGIDTGTAFQLMDKFFDRQRFKKMTGLVFNREGPLLKSSGSLLEKKGEDIEDLYNSFEDALMSDYPVLVQIRDSLYSKFNAGKVLLAGSGSTMVALYSKETPNFNQIYNQIKEAYESKKYSVIKSKFLDPVLNL